MAIFWVNLTDAQASLLSTFVIVFAGGIGVLFSALLFGNRVRNLETALKASEDKINDALAGTTSKIDAFNAQLADKLGLVDEQFSATLDALGQLRASVGELQDSADRNADDLRSQLRQHWSVVSEELDEIASNPRIHGKTRARYSRIPRRTTEPLLTALIQDGHIPADRVAFFKEAAELWRWHKNGRATLAQSDVDKMRELAIRLVPNYGAQ